MKTAQRTNLVNAIFPALGKKKDVEGRLIQLGTGILRGLRASRMTFEEAHLDLFNMDVYLAAKKWRVGPLLLKFLSWGMELEDVLEIVPQGLGKSFEEMERLLESAKLKRAMNKIVKARIKERSKLRVKPISKLQAARLSKQERGYGVSHASAKTRLRQGQRAASRS
jgi:hypothetical protein